MGMGRSSPIDYAVLAVAVVNVSTASILVRLAGVHGFVAASWRLILGTLLTAVLLLLLYAAGRHRRPLIPAGKDLLLAIASGVALALHFDLWMVSLFHLSVALSVTIVDSYPAVLAVVGRVVFGERYTVTQLLGALIAFLGVAGIAWYTGRGAPAPEGGDPVLGFILALAGMLAVAAYFSIGRGLRARYTTLEYTLPVYLVAALASSLLTLTLGERLTGYSPATYVYLALLAILPMLGGHTLINYALGRLTLLAATVPILGEPVVAAILAWLILGEPLGPIEALLMGITLLGIGMVLVGEERGRG